jgi:ubiquinone/menaquinone biosynthesis C-methylase UbiE
MLPPTDYDGRMAEVYDRGRAYPVEWLEPWREALAPFLPPPEGQPILDLGSGTGQWSPVLADWFAVPILAIEPADGMRRQALAKGTHPAVSLIGGRGERLPLRDASVGAAWLSTVLHHFEDLAGALTELRRVLGSNGPVLVRQAFPGRVDDVLWTRYFPEAERIAERRWLGLEPTMDAFEVAGFRREVLARVTQVVAGSLREYADRVRTRADSSLALLDDSVFESGMAALDADAAQEEDPQPVRSTIDFVAFR